MGRSLTGGAGGGRGKDRREEERGRAEVGREEEVRYGFVVKNKVERKKKEKEGVCHGRYILVRNVHGNAGVRGGEACLWMDLLAVA